MDHRFSILCLIDGERVVVWFIIRDWEDVALARSMNGDGWNCIYGVVVLLIKSIKCEYMELSIFAGK
jgi:hypothetical protein